MLFDKFVTIHTIDDIWPHIETHEQANFFIKDFKSPENDAFKSQVIFYNTCYNEVFTNNFLAEGRGITFDESGNIILRPLHKFFNIGENEHVTVDKIKERGVDQIYDKVDGSMINFYVHNGVLYAKSKKSWVSDVALDCMEYLKEDMRRYEAVKRFVETTQASVTCTFEFTSPNNRIVVKYDDQSLTLLQVRNLYTGEYLNAEDYYRKNMGHMYDVVKPPVLIPHDIDALLDIKDSIQGLEGYVVKTKDGNMAKLKCDWYVLLHRNVTFLRERDVAESVLEECVDDVYSNLAQDESFELERRRVRLIWDEVVKDFNNIDDKMMSYIEEVNMLKNDPKSYFDKYRDDYLARLAWSYATKGQNVDEGIKKYFKNHVLKQKYSLDMIASDNVGKKYGDVDSPNSR